VRRATSAHEHRGVERRAMRTPASTRASRSLNASMSRASTKMRDRLEQRWPVVAQIESAASVTASSRSASAHTSIAFLPPISSASNLPG
jgi:hypothetical protein